MTAHATLSHAAARTLYDHIGRWQDTQRFYEDRATADLIAHADLGTARSVFEFGAGTESSLLRPTIGGLLNAPDAVGTRMRLQSVICDFVR